MMKRKMFPLLLAAAAGLTLVACDKQAEKPEGQVVATVDGSDVTIHEVNAEINAMGAAARNAPRKLAEAVALARVIERKMVAAEARTRKLDQSPQFVLAKARNDENLLVQALQADVAGKVQATPREAAQKFISENPVMFADRRIMSLDQIQFLRPNNIESIPLKDAKTMAEVERVLLASNVEFRRAPQQIDTLVVDPKISKEVMRVSGGPNSEPFMFIDRPAAAPAPVVYINVVTETKQQPFLGERAITYAQQLIQRQEVTKRLQAELTRLKDANKAKVTYAAGYDEPQKVADKLKKEAEAKAKANAPAGAPATAPAAPAAPAPAAPAAAEPAAPNPGGTGA
jgi:EpsD family peptidyl-prolyl cis-trans isomerase